MGVLLLGSTTDPLFEPGSPAMNLNSLTNKTKSETSRKNGPVCKHFCPIAEQLLDEGHWIQRMTCRHIRQHHQSVRFHIVGLHDTCWSYCPTAWLSCSLTSALFCNRGPIFKPAGAENTQTC